MSWDEYDEEESAVSSTQSQENLGGIQDESHNPNESECKVSGSCSCDKNMEDELKTKDGRAELHLTASGEVFFYLLRFNGFDLVLIKKVRKKVSSQIFVKDLYVVSDKKLYGFYDVISTPGSLDDLLKPERKRKKANGSLLSDESHEEYIYRPCRKNGKIILKREEGKSDIVSNWEGFFITSGLAHKIVYEDGRYNFVYNSKKYSYEKVIGGIAYNNGMLVYYLKGKDSSLYFQGDHEKIYNIPKITVMSCEGQRTIVGTADGYIYLFDRCVLSKRRKVYDVPITGVGFMNDQVYFSSLDGFVGTEKTTRGFSMFLIMVSIGIFIFAIVMGIISKTVRHSFLDK
ncbi:hypothetical protein EROM_091720 [Encephalitozoon romaleae SJ-2008]|uniref:Uncharacterized protein n=1 Tax=Encephalitozoon romaleae (strain SJ-2008) TaxID=1178016 RepID=I6ZKH1_ENCRO|nr:hypothetical protein EROM_091720 [Encephalitozoon romaleae SJ-2008]AFN83788.1 hypothetical protein EROM_091720 [Encephalitozoon romaleae SJ-2008]